MFCKHSNNLKLTAILIIYWDRVNAPVFNDLPGLLFPTKPEQAHGNNRVKEVNYLSLRVRGYMMGETAAARIGLSQPGLTWKLGCAAFGFLRM